MNIFNTICIIESNMDYFDSFYANCVEKNHFFNYFYIKIFYIYILLMTCYTCDDCGKNFDRKSSYVNHINRSKSCKTTLNELTYKCSNCKSYFSRKNNLQRHLKICKCKYEKEIDNDLLENAKNEIISHINNVFGKKNNNNDNNNDNNDINITNNNNNNNNNINSNNNVNINVYLNSYTNSNL